MSPVAGALQALVERFGPEVVHDARRVRAGVNDLLGADARRHRAEVDAVVIVAEEVGLASLLEVDPGDQDRERGLEAFGLAAETSAHAIAAWRRALGVAGAGTSGPTDDAPLVGTAPDPTTDPMVAAAPPPPPPPGPETIEFVPAPPLLPPPPGALSVDLTVGASPDPEAGPEPKVPQRRLALVALLALVAVMGIGGAAMASVLRDDGGGSAKPTTTTTRVVAAPVFTEVPKVTGMAQEAAVSTLEKAGFEVRVKTRSDEHVATGVVANQAPAAGGRLREGSRVDLAVSEGPAPRAVPNVVGKPADEALRLLARYGLKASVTAEFAAAPTGTVLRVTPGVGTDQPKGATVALVVSNGPAPTTTVPRPTGTTTPRTTTPTTRPPRTTQPPTPDPPATTCYQEPGYTDPVTGIYTPGKVVCG